MTDLGTRIRARREQVGLRLLDVAASIGSNVSTLSRIENGRLSPTFQQLEAIAAALRCAPADLIPRVVRRAPGGRSRRPSNPSRQ